MARTSNAKRKILRRLIITLLSVFVLVLIITTLTSNFYKDGEGLLIIKPFAETPAYNLNYKVQQFDVASLFNTFLVDTIISGKMDLDLAKLIERFKRSQKFTMADVGAVMLMGPAGIFVTKGSEFASLIVLNPGESCEVVGLSSEWEVDNGVISLTDVA